MIISNQGGNLTNDIQKNKTPSAKAKMGCLWPMLKSLKRIGILYILRSEKIEQLIW